MIQSLTIRLADSIPGLVIEKWRNELVLGGRTDLDRAIELERRIEDYLDAGHGSCCLRRREVAQLVEGALLYFDGERYRLLAWCVMPNHLHVLIETLEGYPLGKVVHSWKSYTANRANRLLGRSGPFWQRDYHDRYIRNAEHYQNVLDYIEDNPVKAGLARSKADWAWSSARFRCGF